MAVDAVPGELFSAPNSLLTGKFTGNFMSSAEALGDKSPPESALAEKLGFRGQSEQGTIREGTGNGIPCYLRLAAKMLATCTVEPKRMWRTTRSRSTQNLGPRSVLPPGTLRFRSAQC